MKWKTKARLQNAIAALPSGLSYATYYWLQRHFGRLKTPDPTPKFKAAAEIWKKIYSLGIEPTEKTFFELGTGRVPSIPIAFWLMGAGKIITMDTNPYLRGELLSEIINYISINRNKIQNILSPFLLNERLNALIELSERNDTTAKAILDLCNIAYIAPGDATNTNLTDNSVDFYTSCTVLEHVHPDTLRKIFREGDRIVRESGLFIHRIDYSDHFSHSDRTISPVNFLQYSGPEWKKYAGNRYMYMNRLRHDDFLELFREAGHSILINQPDTNNDLLELLESGTFHLSDEFRSKPVQILAITGAWIVTQKQL